MSQDVRLVIVDELERLLKVLQGRKHVTWKLELAELTRDENRLFERKIKKYHMACGCSHGAAAMFLSLISYVALLFLGDLHRSDRIVVEVVAGLVLILLSVGLGKMFGLLLARRGLRRSVEQLRQRIDAIRSRVDVPVCHELLLSGDGSCRG